MFVRLENDGFTVNGKKKGVIVFIKKEKKKRERERGRERCI